MELRGRFCRAVGLMALSIPAMRFMQRMPNDARRTASPLRNSRRDTLRECKMYRDAKCYADEKHIANT